MATEEAITVAGALRKNKCSIICFGTLTLMLIAGFLFGPFYQTGRQDLLLAYGPWTRRACMLVATAMAYRGNCRVSSDPTAAARFQECPVTAKQLGIALKGGMENCNHTAVNDRREDELLAHGRRLGPEWHYYAGEYCYDAYLVWSLVKIINGSTATGINGWANTSNDTGSTLCAFAYGEAAYSVTDDYVEAAGALHQHHTAFSKSLSLPCWSYGTDLCIIAMDHPNDMMSRGLKDAAHIQHLGFALSLVSMIGLGGFAVQYKRILAEHLAPYCSSFASGDDYESVPTVEDISDSSSYHAKRIMDTAVECAKHDTPPTSPLHTMRLKIDGRRNLADDFL